MNRLFTSTFAALFLTFLASALPAKEAAPKVPGIVIHHSPAANRIYLGSPSIVILPNGHYIASHDEFGPGSSMETSGKTRIYRSTNRGENWQQEAELDGQFWSSLFVHRNALYILGSSKQSGKPVIRRSTDNGTTWTTPANASTGLLRPDVGYHAAPTPVIEHAGRIWRAMEHRDHPEQQNDNQAGMLSAPLGSDLLDAANWTWSNFIPHDPKGKNSIRWLEGNAVVTPDQHLVNILRVDTRRYPEEVAWVSISDDGKTASFDPATGFHPFPGGAKKFSIRRDPTTNLYWSLATIVPERHQSKTLAGFVRNTLALTCSPDLTNWTTRCILLYHPDTAKHGFQYVDWQFDGSDLVAVCRTAFDDEHGSAHNNHDSNYLTFHRFRNFRELTMKDSVPAFKP